MKKTYYAKYVVYPGVIKPGDRWLNTHTLETGICDEDFKQYQGKEFKLTRLAICTKDVELNEIVPLVDVFHDERGMTHRVGQCWIDSRSKFNHLWFKVIGRVSENATWVREGDTFTAEQIAWFHDDGSDGYTLLSDMIKLIDSENRNLGPDDIRVRFPEKFYAIQNEQTLTFH